MTRHGRHRMPLPDAVRDTVVWGGFACVLAAAVLVWSGTRWPTVLLVAGGLLVLGLVSYAALRASGLKLRSLDDSGGSWGDRRA